MRSRNVILSLILVLALLAFTFMKVRFWEPKRKLTFNRNPYRIEYLQLALCRMDCHHISANDITEIIKTGKVNVEESNLKNKPCPLFAVQGVTKKRVDLQVFIIQCGRVAKVINCSSPQTDFDCQCPGEHEKDSPKISKYNFPEFFSTAFATWLSGRRGE